MFTLLPTGIQALREDPYETLRFRVLRDGVVTPGVKTLRIVRGFDSTSQAGMALEALDGELTRSVDILRQELADQPTWIVYAQDSTPPARVWAQFLTIASGGLYTVNILTGSGSEATSPARVGAMVRVDGIDAAREVLVVERKLDGEWRIAGSGETGTDGTGVIDLDYVDGSVYMLGMDDYGTPFSGGLAVSVGRRIRPTVFAGVLYEVTEAGVLPPVEPAWWGVNVDGSRELGTARAVAVRYYQPIGFGPEPIEII